MKIAIYPGSFDPITLGHVDIANRAKGIFDKVIIMVAENTNKASTYTFSLDERYLMAKKVFENKDGFKVIKSKELTVQECKKYGAKYLIRGLRAVGDFESEYQLSEVNYFLDKDIDMIYFFSRGDYSFISSSIVKELFFHNKDISNIVPKEVLTYMNDRYKNLTK